MRKYYLSIADINSSLSKVHQAVMPHIDLEKYKYTTEYIHRYISYTSVWNLKFVVNLESPEVALLQAMSRYIEKGKSQGDEHLTNL